MRPFSLSHHELRSRQIRVSKGGIVLLKIKKYDFNKTNNKSFSWCLRGFD